MRNSDFKVKTPRAEYNVEVYSDFIKKEDVRVQRELFLKMCREGCVNYGKKFSCPPSSRDFMGVVDKEGIYVVMFLMRLENIESTEYNKVRIANSIMKSRLDKLMRVLESRFNTKFLSTGSCRLCRTCQLKLKKLCKHSDKMRYSLESTGVDCDFLSKSLFNLPLLWFKQGKAPEYTCVITGLVCDKNETNKITLELENLLKNISTTCGHYLL
jgi:predicted metal-binding protein